MFPAAWMKGEALLGFGGDVSECAIAVLAACGPSIQVDLRVGMRNTRGGPTESDTLLALQLVTPKQQQRAREWVTANWEERLAPRKGAPMPAFGEKPWWKFVQKLVANNFGLSCLAKKGTQGVHSHRLVTATFWDEHDIDLSQVAADHRSRDPKRLDGPVIRDGRPFGVLLPQMCRCALCPPGRPVTPCVRQMRRCDRCPAGHPATRCAAQHARQWVCVDPDAHAGVTATCHRDFYTPMDVAHLDVDVPNGHMYIAEIKELKEDTSYDDADANDDADDAHTALGRMVAALPETHQNLLRDLGFVHGVYAVAADQMQRTWEAAPDVAYLRSLEQPPGSLDSDCTLFQYGNRGENIKAVRAGARVVLGRVHLQITHTRPSLAGVRRSMFHLSADTRG
jgi:hypothetical protein